MHIPIPPGVFDLVPKDSKEKWKESHLWQMIEALIRETARLYGFSEIRTPVFERTELFQRGVGTTSDIVSKEMYTFTDKGNRSMSLRPEGTAPVMRAFIEHQFHQQGPIHKLFYIAPMFRYERAQAGRYRQHHQFGVEVIGNDSAAQDVEVIDLLMTFYKSVGLKNLKLVINSIGSKETRENYKQALMHYLRPLYDELSEDSKVRFETNPLRILDSKNPRDREIVADSPSLLDFLDQDEKRHFEEVQRLLNQLGIDFEVNPLLVRGLDYYNKTVFEVVAGDLGAQNSIGGGGRYDGLLGSLGGPDLPCFGFGTGLERIIQTLINQEIPLPPESVPKLFFVGLGEKAQERCFSWMKQARAEGIACQMDFSKRKIGKILQYASDIGSEYVVVVGDQELESGQIQIKNMKTGEKSTYIIENLINQMKAL